MRTIKFRGLRTDSKGWVYGDLLRKNDNRFGGQHFKIFVDTDDPTEEGELIKVDGSTIGQFTGLYDKVGKEIYEDDIVDVWSAGSHLKDGIIKFGQGTAKFFILNKNSSAYWNLSGGGDNYIQEDLIVIGNVFENPELLKTVSSKNKA